MNLEQRLQSLEQRLQEKLQKLQDMRDQQQQLQNDIISLRAKRELIEELQENGGRKSQQSNQTRRENQEPKG